VCSILHLTAITGLKYFEELQERIPRSEVQKIEELIGEVATNIDPEYVVTIAGS
jgi:hypothetical protein